MFAIFTFQEENPICSKVKGPEDMGLGNSSDTWD
jgi:hypothetical protein